jgi:hypothetical protein
MRYVRSIAFVLTFLGLLAACSPTNMVQRALTETPARPGASGDTGAPTEVTKPQPSSTITRLPTTPAVVSTTVPAAASSVSAGITGSDLTPTVAPGTVATPTAEAPTTTTDAQGLKLISKGFGQNKRSAVAAFVVENTNQNLAAERTAYQVAVYDKSGAVIKAESGYMTLILPTQRIGEAVSLFLPEGAIIDHVDVQIKPGNFQPTDAVDTFTHDKVVLRPGLIGDRVTAIIKSPFQRDFDEVHVAAIAYDAQGVIIGGGSDFVGFVPAQGQAAVDIGVTTSKPAAKFDLFPSLSELSLLGANVAAAPPGSQTLRLTGKGYGQKGTSVSYAFLVENPNSSYSVERSRYQVAAYAADGTVLRTSSGFLTLLLPNQKSGEAGSLFVEGNAVVARLDVQIESGTYTSSDPLPTFGSSNVTFRPGTFSATVTGIVKSPYQKDVKLVQVAAVVYDQSGSIIGGGTTILDFVPANGQAAVEVPVTVGKTPAKVELYATVSGLSAFG